MILKRDESEVAVLGDVQKYKVGIDERNINHIVTILSSNLYSYPMTSFLRETVSNAVDSHIEAGTNEPIIVTITPDDVSIRDFGTGISPERFQEIYLNIGSSTKRDSNEYIGSFGLGRFSCLSISDLANVTSFYNGKAYYYVMNKDIDQLHIDKLYEKDTTEPNGVEVKVPIHRFDFDSLDCLDFIKAVYINNETTRCTWETENFNNRKVYIYKNFKILDREGRYARHPEVLLGLIPYRVDLTALWDSSDSWHKSWYDTFNYIYPIIDIGQLDITPNREGLLYSERTKAVLRKAYDACIDELKELWNAYCKQECNDIFDYIGRITSYGYNKLDLNGLEISVSKLLPYNTLYKKYPEWSNLKEEDRKHLINYVLGKELDVFGKLCGDTLHQGKRYLNYFTVKHLIRDWLNYDYKKVLVLPSKTGFSSTYFKGFVAEKYGIDDILFIRKLHRFTISYTKSLLLSIFTISDLKDSQYRKFIFQFGRELLQGIIGKVIVTDIMGSPEYAQYKKDHIVKKERKQISTERICFTIAHPYGNSQIKDTLTLEQIIPYIKRTYSDNNRIVYADLDSPFLEAFMELRYPNLIILSAAKGKMKLLQEGLPEWVKPIEVLYSPDDKYLRRFATMRYIINQGKIDTTLSCIRSYFPTWVNATIKKLYKCKDKYLYKKSHCYGCDSNDLLNIVPEEKYDRWMLGQFNSVKKYLELGRKIDMSGAGSYLDFYALLKAKKFRPAYSYYASIREYINELLKNI